MPNIIINNTCNQRCSYCFAEESMTYDALPVKNQKYSTFISILRFLRKNNYDDVRFLWWEPLLHPFIEKFMILAHKGWFRTRLFSNLNFPTEYIQEKFQSPKSIPQTINANINNRDFYSDIEYSRVIVNLLFFRNAGTLMTIGYNIYDLSKSFDDIVYVARETWIKHINLKITNSTIGSSLIVDTWSRAYGEYIFDIIKKYGTEFEFVFSCGLTRSIFLESEIKYMNQLWIFPRYGCDGFSGRFDIDIDGSIYKCFPTRTLYLKKNLSIYNFASEEQLFSLVGITPSSWICRAHSISAHDTLR
jgi:MoaA/NifB/PqqE/SkfB family radical SAM enzyme